MIYLCDDARHLVCLPFSIENLHQMAIELGIKRCWFHSSSKFSHYDIPKRRVKEITSVCRIVSTKDIIRIIKKELTNV
jgi:hypothetical protein